MAEKEYGLITFKSTHAAMASQKELKGISFQICPVLRMISASCGIALRVSMGDMEKAKEILNNSPSIANMFDTYCIFTEDGKQNFRKI